jgi:hypothetical protein
MNPCLLRPLKSIAADVHDWAMNPQAEKRENFTLTHIGLRHGVGNCHGVDNGVTLRPA